VSGGSRTHTSDTWALGGVGSFESDTSDTSDTRAFGGVECFRYFGHSRYLGSTIWGGRIFQILALGTVFGEVGHNFQKFRMLRILGHLGGGNGSFRYFRYFAQFGRGRMVYFRHHNWGSSDASDTRGG